MLYINVLGELIWLWGATDEHEVYRYVHGVAERPDGLFWIMTRLPF